MQHNAFFQAKIQRHLQIFKEFLKKFKYFSRTKAENSKLKEFSRTVPFFKDFSRPVRTMFLHETEAKVEFAQLEK